VADVGEIETIFQIFLNRLKFHVYDTFGVIARLREEHAQVGKGDFLSIDANLEDPLFTVCLAAVGTSIYVDGFR
jgi:hypothetical protein